MFSFFFFAFFLAKLFEDLSCLWNTAKIWEIRFSKRIPALKVGTVETLCHIDRDRLATDLRGGIGRKEAIKSSLHDVGSLPYHVEARFLYNHRS